MLEKRAGIGADRGPGGLGPAAQRLEVSCRVDLGARGVVGWVDGGLARGDARVELYELAVLVELDRLRVRPGTKHLADEAVVHAVEALLHLDSEVAMDLRVRPVRQVVGRGRCRHEQRLLLGPEDLGRTQLGASVDAHAGTLATPDDDACPGVGEPDEALTGKEALADEGNRSFYTWLVIGACKARRVDVKSPRLGVLQEGVVEARGDLVGGVHDLCEIIRDDDREDTLEEGPRLLEALDHRLDGLAKAEIDVAVPAVTGGEDEGVEDLALVLAGGDEPEPAEVDL